MLRIATLDDLDLIVKFTTAFCASIKQADIIDRTTVDKIIMSYLTGNPEEKICLLNGEEGMLAAFIQPFVLGLVPIGVEAVWWVDPDARKKSVGRELVSAFEFWAKKLNCKYTVMSCYADNDVGKFYESVGYGLHEKAYIKEL